MAGELNVQIELPLTDAGREFYASLDACMASAGLHPGEFCMEDSRKTEGNFTPINWDQRGQPNDQRGSVWNEFIGPPGDGWLWLFVFYADGNRAEKMTIRTFQDGEEWMARFETLCISLHKAFHATDTRGTLEDHVEAWFRFSRDVWRPPVFPDLEAERAQKQAMAGKMITWAGNAPVHWPPVVAPLLSQSVSWLYAHPDDARSFAERMARAFAESSCNCRIYETNTRWNYLEVPIQVQDGQQIVRVFLYAYSTIHTAHHFASVREFLSEHGEPDPVYYAPLPLPPIDERPPDDVTSGKNGRTGELGVRRTGRTEN